MKREEAIIIGERLKNLRYDAGLTQQGMAEVFEITDAAWRQYELGIRIPNDKIKKKIAVHFNQTVDEMFFQ